MADSRSTEEKLPPFVVKEGGGYRYRWGAAAAFSLLVYAAILLPQLVIYLLAGPPLRLNSVVSMVITFTTLLITQGLRQQRILQAGQLRAPWYQFGFQELLVLFTGLTVFVAFLAVQQQQEMRFKDALRSLEVASGEVLGPDSHVYHNTDGIHVSLCDRTFDDARLAEFTRLASEAGLLRQIDSLRLGSNARTIGTPAEWPGITNDSVGSLMKWRSLSQLHLDGTAISEQAAVRLADLPRLEWLDTTDGFGPENAEEIKRKRPDLWIGADGDFP